MHRGLLCRIVDCRRMRADIQRPNSSAGSIEPRALVGRGPPSTVPIWRVQAFTGRARSNDPRTLSTVEHPA